MLGGSILFEFWLFDKTKTATRINSVYKKSKEGDMQQGSFLLEDQELQAEHFQESLRQLLADPNFLQSFYAHFLEAHPEIQHFFVGKDLAQIQKKLKTTLKLLQAQDKKEPGIVNYLQMLGRMHQQLGVTHSDFLLWKQALLETVAKFDPAYTEHTRRAWAYALDSIIATMTMLSEEGR
jgi:hemoglobin-like flavoprotein